MKKKALVNVKQSDISKDNKLIINNQAGPFHFSEALNTSAPLARVSAVWEDIQIWNINHFAAIKNI